MTVGLRRAWWAVVAPAVAIGLGLAVVLVPTELAISVILLSTWIGWLRQRASTGWPRWLGPCAVVTPLGVLALVGWITAGGPVVLLPAFALVCAAAALERCDRDEGGRQPGYRVTAPPVPAEPVTATPPTGDAAVADLSTLTDAQLCRVWRASYPGVIAGSGDPAFDALVDTRRRYLDELERRHPAGFAAWISSGARAAGDPEPYLRPRPQRPVQPGS